MAPLSGFIEAITNPFEDNLRSYISSTIEVICTIHAIAMYTDDATDGIQRDW